MYLNDKEKNGFTWNTTEQLITLDALLYLFVHKMLKMSFFYVLLCEIHVFHFWKVLL